MSEGRLAPVREADRHAALIAGLAAALFSGGTFALLHAVAVTPSLESSDDFTSSFGFLLAVAIGFGFVAGCAEGAVAARAARRAAGNFIPLPAFTFHVFIGAAMVNVVLVSVATATAYSGVDLAAALFLSILVALAASALGSAFLGWSHAIDWPQIPDYMRLQNGAVGRPSKPSTAIETDTPSMFAGSNVVMDDPSRNPVIEESRKRRSSETPVNDDALWDEVQELIKRK